MMNTPADNLAAYNDYVNRDKSLEFTCTGDDVVTDTGVLIDSYQGGIYQVAAVVATEARRLAKVIDRIKATPNLPTSFKCNAEPFYELAAAIEHVLVQLPVSDDDDE